MATSTPQTERRYKILTAYSLKAILMGLGGRTKIFQEHMYLTVLFTLLNIPIMFLGLLGIQRNTEMLLHRGGKGFSLIQMFIVKTKCTPQLGRY